MFRTSMFQTSMLLVLLCLCLTVSEGQFSFNAEEYNISKEGGSSDFTISQADVRRGLEVARALASVFSSRLGLAYPVSADDPSINEIDSVDYFPSNNVNISTTTENEDFSPSHTVNISTTTEEEDYSSSNSGNMSTPTEKPNIVWGLFTNSSSIVPGSNNRVSGSEIEGLTSITTTTKPTDTRVTVPEHPTSLVEFVNAQLSLLMPMFTNFFKLTEHFSRETIDTLSDIINSVWDFFWEIIDLFSIDFDYDYDYDYDYDTKKTTVTFNISDFYDSYTQTFY